MMAQLQDYRLDIGEKATDGEIGIAAFSSDEKIQIFLFRQKMKNLILPKEHVKVKIQLASKPNDIRLQRVDEDHGNPLSYWETIGKPEDMTKNQVNEIIMHTKVSTEMWPHSYTDGLLTLEAA